MAAGESIITAANTAFERKTPLVLFIASGGARMQEGILSLMQLPRTTVAIRRLRNAGLPYIAVLTNPTTGGVTASYAMLGDIHIAEPGAMIGFAGRASLSRRSAKSSPRASSAPNTCAITGWSIWCCTGRKSGPPFRACAAC